MAISLADVPRAPHAPVVAASPLRRLCGGRVFLPGDIGYDDARLPWVASVDQRPAAVVCPRSVADISEVVRCAAGLGLRVVLHGAGDESTPSDARGLDGVVLVRVLEDGHPGRQPRIQGWSSSHRPGGNGWRRTA